MMPMNYLHVREEIAEVRGGLEALCELCESHVKIRSHASILFTKQMRGTRYLSAWRHNGFRLPAAHADGVEYAHRAVQTRSERSTSTVKSTWPGVSIMLRGTSY